MQPEVSRGQVRVFHHPTVRLVGLVTSTRPGSVSFLTAHSCPGLATDLDLVVAAGVGAPYPLVVCAELYGTVFDGQVGRLVGALDGAAVDAVAGSLRSDGETLEWFRVGLPLAGMNDPRRRHLNDHLETLTVVCAAYRQTTAG